MGELHEICPCPKELRAIDFKDSRRTNVLQWREETGILCVHATAWLWDMGIGLWMWESWNEISFQQGLPLQSIMLAKAGSRQSLQEFSRFSREELREAFKVDYGVSFSSRCLQRAGAIRSQYRQGLRMKLT